MSEASAVVTMDSKIKHTVSAVIPMYNEVENVKPFLEEVHRALTSFCDDFEMVVVDDGSKDNTYNALLDLQKSMPQLKVIRHKRNYGQSVAMVSGVTAARLDWIATLDGDGQNDPADIQKLFTAIAAKSPAAKRVLAIGNRTKRRDTWLRKISSRIAYGARASLLRDDCPDTGCSLKLFRREDFLTLPHFNHLHRYIPALYRRMQGDVINVPVNHRPRLRGQSKYGVMNRLWVGIVDLMGVMWLIRRPCTPEFDEQPH